MGLCTAPGSNRWPKGLCDTAGVVSLSRRLRIIEEPRMAATSLGVALLVVLAAYAYAVATGPAVVGGVGRAVALVGIARTGLRCALLAMRPDYRFLEEAASGLWRQAGAVGAALLLAVLAYAAFRGNFAHATFNGGPFGSVAVGRLLFAHDALATEAVGGLVLASLVGAAGAWRRERPRDERGEGRR